MKRVLLFVSLSVLFVGCAPQYVVKNQYIPPLDSASKVCLKTCNFELDRCNQRCSQEYSDCLSYAYDDAKKIQNRLDIEYKKRYDDYLAELDIYRVELDRYKRKHRIVKRDFLYFRSMCLKNRDRYACEREDELGYLLKKMKHKKPIMPLAPSHKSFSAILLDEQRKCRKDCGCENLYDSCFVGCGGEIVPHRICVKNCD